MLLFLHGFLGNKEDWDPVFSHLPTTLEKLAIDLPGHGTRLIKEDLAQLINKEIPKAEMIIGYSAGGRLALELKERFPKNYNRVIAISAHIGLKTKNEKKKRWERDEKWIQLLRTSSWEEFFQKWYAQELFQNFKKTPFFSQLLQQRKNHDPKKIAQFLEQYSLAKKKRPKLYPNTVFIHGKQDLKYGSLYLTLTRMKKIFSIHDAGHVVHLEKPKACAMIIQGAIDDNY